MTLVARALRAWPAACRPCRGNPCQHLDGREWVVARGDTVHMYRLRRGFVTKAEFDAAHDFGFPCAAEPMSGILSTAVLASPPRPLTLGDVITTYRGLLTSSQAPRG